VSQSHASAVPVASRSRSGRTGFMAFIERLLELFLSGLPFRAFIKRVGGLEHILKLSKNFICG
jgi:hypothetical protein